MLMTIDVFQYEFIDYDTKRYLLMIGAHACESPSILDYSTICQTE